MIACMTIMLAGLEDAVPVADSVLRMPVARFILIVIPGLPRINPRQNPESALSADSTEADSRFHPRFIADGPE
jgi:hypothetical protein